MRIGIVGSSVAVAGSAALAAIAPSAGAAPAQASSGGYHAKADAGVGVVTIAGTKVSLLSASANSVNGSDAHSNSIGSGQLLTALQNVSILGPALADAFQRANPGHLDLATVSATASPSGTSAGCAAVLAADCTAGGQPRSLVLKIGLGDLPAGLLPASVSSLVSQLGGTLADSTVVLRLHGPRAACAVGPAGSSDVSAHASLAGASVDIQAGGKSLLPTGPVALKTGGVFAQLLVADKGSPVGSLVSMLSAKLPLGVIVDSSSRKYSAGPKATATAAELGLTSNGTTIFDVKLANANCGPNTEAASAPAPTPVPSTGSSTSGEQPLSGIQTDEGSSAVPAAKSWLALNGMP